MHTHIQTHATKLSASVVRWNDVLHANKEKHADAIENIG